MSSSYELVINNLLSYLRDISGRLICLLTVFLCSGVVRPGLYLPLSDSGPSRSCTTSRHCLWQSRLDVVRCENRLSHKYSLSPSFYYHTPSESHTHTRVPVLLHSCVHTRRKHLTGHTLPSLHTFVHAHTNIPPTHAYGTAEPIHTHTHSFRHTRVLRHTHVLPPTREDDPPSLTLSVLPCVLPSHSLTL